jgi:serine/threonine protein kinase
MATIDLWAHFQIPKKVALIQKYIDIPLEFLPKQFIDDTIRVGGSTRCKIQYGAMENRGGYGSIYRAKRIANGQTSNICVKIPHTPSFSLCSEALIQWFVGEALKKVNIHGAVPEVYDIFQYAGETRVGMSFIEGVGSMEWVLSSSTPEKTFLQILAQLSLLLSFLEEGIHFDHRDLKGDNIWIRPVPIDYRVTVEGKAWCIKAPFQVVILDFGFSCIGGSDGNAVLSLSDGILPEIDPCPKEGRDLFQFIASLWSHRIFRSKMSAEFQAEMDLLLSYRNKPYASLVKQTIETRWVYLLVSDSKFSHPPLHPLSLLRTVSIKYGDIGITSE